MEAIWRSAAQNRGRLAAREMELAMGISPRDWQRMTIEITASGTLLAGDRPLLGHIQGHRIALRADYTLWLAIDDSHAVLLRAHTRKQYLELLAAMFVWGALQGRSEFARVALQPPEPGSGAETVIASEVRYQGSPAWARLQADGQLWIEPKGKSRAEHFDISLLRASQVSTLFKQSEVQIGAVNLRVASEELAQQWLLAAKSKARLEFVGKDLEDGLLIAPKAHLEIIQAEFSGSSSETKIDYPLYAQILCQNRPIFKTSPVLPDDSNCLFWRETIDIDLQVPPCPLELQIRESKNDTLVCSAHDVISDTKGTLTRIPMSIKGSEVLLSCSVDLTPRLSHANYKLLEQMIIKCPIQDVISLLTTDASVILLNIYQYLNLQDEFFHAVTLQEMSKAKNDTVLRGNSILTLSIEKYSNRIGKKYIEQLYKPIIDLVTGCSGEDAVSEEAQYDIKTEEGKTQFIQLLKTVWERILSSTNDIPLNLRSTWAGIRQAIDISGKAGSNGLERNALSSIIFLRFLIPPLLNPKMFGLTSNHVTNSNTASTLAYLAKVLMAMANGSAVNEVKDKNLAEVNGFINDMTQEVEVFFDKVTLRKVDFNERLFVKNDESGPESHFTHLQQIELQTSKIPNNVLNELPLPPFMILKSLELQKLVNLIHDKDNKEYDVKKSSSRLSLGLSKTPTSNTKVSGAGIGSSASLSGTNGSTTMNKSGTAGASGEYQLDIIDLPDDFLTLDIQDEELITGVVSNEFTKNDIINQCTIIWEKLNSKSSTLFDVEMPEDVDEYKNGFDEFMKTSLTDAWIDDDMTVHLTPNDYSNEKKNELGIKLKELLKASASASTASTNTHQLPNSTSTKSIRKSISMKFRNTPNDTVTPDSNISNMTTGGKSPTKNVHTTVRNPALNATNSSNKKGIFGKLFKK